MMKCNQNKQTPTYYYDRQTNKNNKNNYKNISTFIANRNYVRNVDFGAVPIYNVNIKCEQFAYNNNYATFIIQPGTSFLINTCGRISSTNLFENNICIPFSQSMLQTSEKFNIHLRKIQQWMFLF